MKPLKVSDLGRNRYPRGGSPPPRRPPRLGGKRGRSLNSGSGFRGNPGRNWAYRKVPRLGAVAGYWRPVIPNREYFHAGFSFLYYKPRRYFSFYFGLPSWWWSIRWFGCGYSPWFASWDWCWYWSPWWHRRYWISFYYYPTVYVPYYCIRYIPFGVWSGTNWFFEFSLPYFYFWVNQAEYADGWYSPYTSRVTVEYDDNSDCTVECSSEPSVVDRYSRVESERRPDSTLEVAKRYVKLGDAYFQDGRYMESADCYLRALAYVPNSPSVYFALADSLFAAGDYHYAAYAIRKGITMDESLAKTDVDKRTFYKNPEDFLEQMRKLESWIAKHPRDSDAWLVLGYNRFFSRDRKGAKEAFLKVAEMVPGDRASELFLKEL